MPNTKYLSGAMIEFASPWLIRGLSFDTSGFDRNATYIWYFVLPLWIPYAFIGFTFGDRLLDRRWMFDESSFDKSCRDLQDAVRDEAVPILTKFSDPSSFVQHAAMINPSADLSGSHLLSLEPMAYAHAWLGHRQDAINWLQKMENVYAASHKSEYGGLVMARSRSIRELIDVDQSALAVQLSQWRQDAINNLKLAKIGPIPTT